MFIDFSQALDLDTPTFAPCLAIYAGYVFVPHEGCTGALFEYGDSVYYVLSNRAGARIDYKISAALEVLHRPTDYLSDMVTRPVAPGALETGLEAALKTAILIRHPQAGLKYEVLFS